MGRAVATFGRVDVWINNAGTSAPRRPFAEGAEDSISAVVSANLIGVYQRLCVAMAGPAAQPAGGWIWNMEGFGSGWPEADGHGDVRRHQARGDLPDRVAGQGDQGSNVKVGFLSPGIVPPTCSSDDYDGQPEAFEKARKIFNILGDRVETVTPWLAEHLLAARRVRRPGRLADHPEGDGPLHDGSDASANLRDETTPKAAV